MDYTTGRRFATKDSLTFAMHPHSKCLIRSESSTEDMCLASLRVANTSTGLIAENIRGVSANPLGRALNSSTHRGAPSIQTSISLCNLGNWEQNNKHLLDLRMPCNSLS